MELFALKLFTSPWKIDPLSTLVPSTTILINEFPRTAESSSVTGPALSTTVSVGVAVGAGVALSVGAGVALSVGAGVGLSVSTDATTSELWLLITICTDPIMMSMTIEIRAGIFHESVLPSRGIEATLFSESKS